MTKKQVKKLFKKYLNNECTEDEKALLHQYLGSFQDANKTWSELNFDNEIKESVWLKIKKDTTPKTISKLPQPIVRKKTNFINYLKYAAIFICILSGSLWYYNSQNKIAPNTVVAQEDDIIIKKADNSIATINTNNEQTLYNNSGSVIGSQNGSQINYIKQGDIKKLVYNEIIVPNGKKIQLTLSDGSTVHINSGSSFKFPENFIPGQKREVYLTGEAYFEITKDTKNPFIVNTSDMGIEVLGTHFNVNSYKENNAFTVLSEGSVSVYQQEKPESATLIIPGEKATLRANSFNTEKVNLDDYLGWRENKLSFNNSSFSTIIKKIERQYGVTIINNYTALNPIKFKGTFKDETIIDLLDTFKESAKFNYEINNNKIIIHEDLTQ